MATDYCVKCKINWSKLKLQTLDELDEVHDVCPICNSRFDLIPGHDGESYYMNADGVLRYTKNGQPVHVPKKQPLPMPPMKPRNEWNPEKYAAWKEEQAAIQDRALDVYIDTHSKAGQDAAYNAYFKIMQTQTPYNG